MKNMGYIQGEWNKKIQRILLSNQYIEPVSGHNVLSLLDQVDRELSDATKQRICQTAYTLQDYAHAIRIAFGKQREEGGTLDHLVNAELDLLQ